MFFLKKKLWRWSETAAQSEDPPMKVLLLGIIPVTARLAIIATIRVQREDRLTDKRSLNSHGLFVVI